MKKKMLPAALSSKAPTLSNKYCKIAGLFLCLIIMASNGYAARLSALGGGGNAASPLCGPANDLLIFSFTDLEGSTATTINAVHFATTGTAVSGTDVTNFKVWSNSSNTLTGATLMGTITTTLGAGAHTLNLATTTLTKSVTTYYFITATIAATATAGHTIVVSALAHAAGIPFTFTGTARPPIQEVQLQAGHRQSQY